MLFLEAHDYNDLWHFDYQSDQNRLNASFWLAGLFFNSSLFQKNI